MIVQQINIGLLFKRVTIYHETSRQYLKQVRLLLQHIFMLSVYSEGYWLVGFLCKLVFDSECYIISSKFSNLHHKASEKVLVLTYYINIL